MQNTHTLSSLSQGRTISALKDTLAHPAYLKHNTNTEDKLVRIVDYTKVYCTRTQTCLLSRQKDTPTPSNTSPQSIESPTAGHRPISIHTAIPGRTIMAQVRNQRPKTRSSLVLSHINLSAEVGPSAHNNGALPPAQVERTRDPRLANRGTKRENDESQYGMSFQWKVARIIEAEGK